MEKFKHKFQADALGLLTYAKNSQLFSNPKLPEVNMKKSIHWFVLFAMVISFSLTGVVSAESIADKLAQFSEANANGYIHPAVNAFGVDMNTGLFRTAKTHKLLGFEIGIKVMMAFVPDKDTKFTTVPLNIADPLNPGQLITYPSTETATVFGGKDEGATVAGPPDFEFPGGIGVKVLPIVVPQASVGLPLSTDLMIRYIPKTEVSKEVGKVGLFGFGLKHNLGQYFPAPLPIGLSAMFSYQKFDLGEIISAKATSFNLLISKGIPFITFYSGIGVEKSSMTISYTVDNPNLPVNGQKIEFDQNGDNNFRLTVGASIKMFLFNVNADYNIGKYNAASLGASFSFR